MSGVKVFHQNIDYGNRTKVAEKIIKERNRIDLAYFPTELLLKIFSYVDFFDQKYIISDVCKNWSTVVADPLLNRSFKIAGPKLSTRNVSEMLSASPYLHSVTLFERADVHKILLLLTKLNRKLKVLRIERCHGSSKSKTLSPAVLITTLKRFTHLEELVIKNTWIDDYGRGLLYTLGFVVPHLRKLTLINISISLREEEARIIVKCCSSLEEIKILQPHGSLLGDKFVETTSSYLLNKLQSLKINAPILTNRALLFLRPCENLRKLHLKYCVNFTDTSIYTIAECFKLTSLNFSMAIGVSSAAWVYLFKKDWMGNVLKIVINQCEAINDDVLLTIGENCSSLQYLGLAGCRNITENGFLHIVFGCKHMIWMDLFYTPARLWKCFILFPQNMKKLRKIIYRSSSGFQGNKYTIELLKAFLPDLAIVDSAETFY